MKSADETTEVKEEQPSILQMEPVEPEPVETVQMSYSFPDDRIDKYKEGKTSIKKTMKELLSDNLAPEEQKSEVPRKSPKKVSPQKQTHTLDDLLGDGITQTTTSPKKQDFVRSGMNLGQRKIIGPSYEEVELKQIAVQPQQEVQNEIEYQDPSEDYDSEDEDSGYNTVGT